jgi:fatty acid desaturase
MLITDPRSAPVPSRVRWATKYLNDPRDAVFIDLMFQCFLFSAVGVSLFWVKDLSIWISVVYWAACFGLVLDRFTLMLHCTSHRALFKPEYAVLNQIIPWVLSPFFGQTPNTYFAHHMGMHHAEENLQDDLSTTMYFRRDSFGHWLRYWARFMTVGLFDLSAYMLRRNRKRLFARILIGEGTYWGTFALLLWLNPHATLTVFAVPLLTIRTLMMMGNWAQHAFIAQGGPDNAYTASITCINSRYNRRCFNDGYHIGHHLKARAHWTEYPVQFERELDAYVAQGAIVFENLDYFMIWLFLMTGRWKALAKAYVPLPGAPVRTEEQIVALLKERVRAFPAPEATASSEPLAAM